MRWPRRMSTPGKSGEYLCCKGQRTDRQTDRRVSAKNVYARGHAALRLFRTVSYFRIHIAVTICHHCPETVKTGIEVSAKYTAVSVSALYHSNSQHRGPRRLGENQRYTAQTSLVRFATALLSTCCTNSCTPITGHTQQMEPMEFEHRHTL